MDKTKPTHIMTDKGLEELPKQEKEKQQWMDVSTWKNIGEKYHFFDFFENKIRREIIKKFIKKLDNYVCSDCGGNCFDKEDIKKIIESL